MFREKLTKKHPVQFGPTLWELIGRATRKFNNKHKTNITLAEYVRRVQAKNAMRVLK